MGRHSNSLARESKCCRQIGNNQVEPHTERRCSTILPETKKRTEEAGEEKHLALYDSVQVLHTRKQGTKLSPLSFCSQCSRLTGCFASTFSRKALLQTTRRRGLTWLPCTDLEELIPFLWVQNAVEAAWKMWTWSWESCPGEKNLPWTYLRGQTLGYLHKIAGKGTL